MEIGSGSVELGKHGLQVLRRRSFRGDRARQTNASDAAIKIFFPECINFLFLLDG